MIVAAGSVLLPAPRSLLAQDSQFGVRGLGTPGQFATARARATGGAFALFDPLSPLGEAALAELRQLTAGAATAPTYRRVDFGGPSASTTATRFPVGGVASPLRPGPDARLVGAAGFTTYLDRSYRIATSRDETLRGAPVTVHDTVASDGAIGDLRLAVAYRLTDRVTVGAAFHRIVGSTRMSVRRRFSDSTFLAYTDSNDVAYEGLGFSVSVGAQVVPTLRAALTARTDGSLTAQLRDGSRTTADLPTTVAGGLLWSPRAALHVGAGAVWRSWSRADATVGGAGGRAFDTFGWSIGAEYGRDVPVRVGYRRSTLPFSPTDEQPREWGLAVGTARLFANRRAGIDLAVEHARRTGPGLRERIWTVLVGLTIKP